MTGPEFIRARQRLGVTTEELAAQLGVQPALVRSWEWESARVPRDIAQNLALRVAIVDQEAAIDAAGLPRCDWFQAWDAVVVPRSLEDEMARAEELRHHVESCATCQDRDRYAEANLPPLPEIAPAGPPLVAKAIGILERAPAWARPPMIGAALVFVMALIRSVGRLPLLLDHPRYFGVVLFWLLVATIAGAIGGLAYTAVHDLLRPLGWAGDYVSGVISVFAYMTAVVLVAYATGERRPGTYSFFSLAVPSMIFGLIIGHLLRRWRDPSAAI